MTAHDRLRSRLQLESLEDRAVPSVTLVDDINPGAGSSNPSVPTAIGSLLYFTAENEPGNREPWVSDGTQAGTHMIKDIAPGSSDPTGGFGPRFVEAGGMVFFIAQDASSVGLWRTDGTAANTVRVGAVELDAFNAQLTAAGNLVFFRAFDAAAGHFTLWRSDGTDAGTFQVTNAAVPTLASLVSFGDKVLFFVGSDLSLERQLWISDGTAAGTQQLADFGFVGASAVLGNQAFIDAAPIGGGPFQLWVTDGTAAGTRLFADVGGLSLPGITVVGDRMFFVTYTTLTETDLWVSDGTAAGTHPVGIPAAVNPLFPYAANGRVFFIDGNLLGPGPVDLWVSDGTAAGSHLVTTINGVLGDAVVGDSFYFLNAGDPTFGGVFPPELWVSDGTAAGTTSVNMGPTIDTSALVSVGPTLYFIATTPATGEELYKLEPDTNVAPSVQQFLVTLANGQTYDLATATRLSLPWAVTGVQVVFSEAVTATANSLSVSLDGAAVAFSGFSGSGTNTLIWNFNAPIALGQVNVALQSTGPDAVRDLDGAALDAAGATHSFSVALGDVSGDGAVSVGDLLAVVRRALRFRFNPATYDVLFDLNLDGQIDAADVRIVATHLGRRL
jgi:ELWxxDGT repeat protein